jgi:hypothetical protein
MGRLNPENFSRSLVVQFTRESGIEGLGGVNFSGRTGWLKAPSGPPEADPSNGMTARNSRPNTSPVLLATPRRANAAIARCQPRPVSTAALLQPTCPVGVHTCRLLKQRRHLQGEFTRAARYVQESAGAVEAQLSRESVRECDWVVDAAHRVTAGTPRMRAGCHCRPGSTTGSVLPEPDRGLSEGPQLEWQSTAR